MTTIHQELSAASEGLAQVGVDTPRLDAELLLAHVLGVSRAQLVIRAHEQASADVRTRYLALLTRRTKREPIAYILRRRDFRRISLAVDERVLIPRPETELLVDVGLALPAGAHVLDVGTGSGAVALALKDERPDLIVAGVDVSAGALSVARLNASRLRLDVAFWRTDLMQELDGGAAAYDRAFPGPASFACDAVLANLPYVAADELLMPEVALYEPSTALLGGGEDGLDLVRRLLSQLGPRAEIKLVALETGATQAALVSELVALAGFEQLERLRDLAGHERVVVGRR
ncbi:MAG: peptide chain release factor N(5)-glutamine methyltransferase [Solirubrobacteraceae bacterium]